MECIDDMYVCVDGPEQGWFVASYACPVGELGERFVGYYKLYPRRPGCFCDAGEHAVGVTPHSFRTQQDAVAAARRAAAGEIAGLGPAGRAPAQSANATFRVAA